MFKIVCDVTCIYFPVPSLPIDIDYDYRRSNIYVTTTNQSIVRYNVGVVENDGMLTLTHNETTTLYYGLGNVTSIAVDWVNDNLYWIVYTYGNDMSQVS